MNKQKQRHPELTVNDYVWLQKRLNNPDYAFLKPDGKKIVFFYEQGRLYEAVIKATSENHEVYLVSFYRTKERLIDKERTRAKKILIDK